MGAEGTAESVRILRAFLIADIRGYSTFAEQRGPEATAVLAGRFVTIASSAIEDGGGTVIDVRGDEVLSVFGSPRAALSAALDLQQRLLAATRTDQTMPLPVGIGLDFGEAVELNGEWSATAINVAARLCSLALGGEIVATEAMTTVVHSIDGARFVARAAVPLKGIDRPVRIVGVSATDQDAAAELHRMGVSRAAVQPRNVHPGRRRRRTVIAAVSVVVLAVVGLTLVPRLWGSGRANVSSRLASNSLGLLGASTGDRRMDVTLGTEPGAVTTGPGSVWVVGPSSNTVTRLSTEHPHDPAVTVQVGDRPDAVALGAGAAWIANSAGRSVSRVNDSAVPTVGDTIAVGNYPTAVAVGYGRVWVTNGLDGTVSVIDPTSSADHVADRVVATIQVGSQPDAIVAGDGGVWVALGATASVVRIDPSSLQVTASIGVGNDPSAITANKVGVWVTNAQDGTVSRIDPRATSVSQTIQVGRAPHAISAAVDHVWVADRESDDVRRIDVHSGVVDRVLRVSRSPAGVAVQDGGVWVSVGEASSAHRGGTLRAVGYEDQRTLDPARTYGQFAWDIESVLHDGLVTFQRTGGPAGAIVVPDLATRLPQISADGLTYTFQLRRGIHYSTGAGVVADDVRASFERLLRSPTAPPYYGDILGGSACSPARRQCDLSRGIRIDDATGLVQFVLSRPDPDFVEQLAIPSADILPAGTSDRDLGYAPRPTTGPYVIASASRSSVTLSRNPRFVPWSAAAQPAGFPDHIAITFRRGTGLDIANVDARSTVAGTYDWSDIPVKAALLNEFVKTKTTQVHAFSDNSVRYFFLNTAVAPFDDVRVRRAVNFGVDRQAALTAFGGARSGTTTCQSLPPSLPGYRPICPYTARPDSSGTWKAPDLAAARALLRRAHATGARVRVVVPAANRAAGRVLVRGMRAIGLQATLNVFARPGVPYDDYVGDYYNYIGTQSNRVQAALEGWVVDYPAPSNLFDPLLRCSARTPKSNLDESEFCEHRIDHAMNAASAEQATNSTAAGLRWAGVDRAVTRQAPWVPLINGQVYDATSTRLGNFEANPELGMLIDQAWVR